MKRIAAEKTLPFEPLVPNAETVEAMKAARRGGVVTAGKPSDFLAPARDIGRVGHGGDEIGRPLAAAAPVVIVWGMSCVTVVAVAGVVGWLASRLRPNAPPPMSGRTLAVAD